MKNVRERLEEKGYNDEQCKMVVSNERTFYNGFIASELFTKKEKKGSKIIVKNKKFIEKIYDFYFFMV